MYSLRLLLDVYNTLYCFLLSTYFDVLAIVFLSFYDAPLYFGLPIFLVYFFLGGLTACFLFDLLFLFFEVEEGTTP